MSRVPRYPLLKAKKTMVVMGTQSLVKSTGSEPRGWMLLSRKIGMNTSRSTLSVGSSELSAFG